MAEFIASGNAPKEGPPAGFYSTTRDDNGGDGNWGVKAWEVKAENGRRLKTARHKTQEKRTGG
jgi:hypothetical protein